MNKPKASLAKSIALLEEARSREDYEGAVLFLRGLGEGDGLASFMAKKRADEIDATQDNSERYRLLNDQIQWMRTRLAQMDYIGQSLDYTKMAAGSYSPVTGEEIRICPKCGRHGLVYDEFKHVTIHIEQIDSWITSRPLDTCEGW